MFRTMKAVKRIYITESGFPAGSSDLALIITVGWAFRQNIFRYARHLCTLRAEVPLEGRHI